jgi:hypothetical protein
MNYVPMPPRWQGLLLVGPSLSTWGKAIVQGTIAAAEVADCLSSALDNTTTSSSHSKFDRVTREGLLAAEADRFDQLAERLEDFKAAAELATAAVNAVLKARAEMTQPAPQEQRPWKSRQVAFNTPATMN